MSLGPGQHDILEIVPRVQRSIEGVVQENWDLAQGEVYTITADACADILLYTGSVFGSSLLVTSRDPATNAPNAWATTVQLSPPQQAIIACQAALTYFFYRFSGVKMSEEMGDEASRWAYSLSPALLMQQLKLLQDQRDKALEAVAAQQGGLDSYVSFLAVRDVSVARYIEPWVYGHPEGYGIGAGGLEGDFRFDMLPTGGGDYTAP